MSAWQRLAGAAIVLALFYAALSSPLASVAWTSPASHDLESTVRASTDAFNAGDYARALAPTRQLADRFPAQHVYHDRLARIYHGLGRRQDEAAAWGAVMRHSPTPWDACPAIAEALNAAGRADDALSAYQRCRDAAPWDPDLTFYLGREHEQRGDAAAAERWYREALSVVTRHDDSQLGLARLALRDGRARDARDRAESVLALAPDHADALLAAATAAHRLGDTESARRHLQRALTQAPNYADVHIAIGIVEFGAGRTEEARRRFERALALDPARRPEIAEWLQRSGSAQ